MPKFSKSALGERVSSTKSPSSWREGASEEKTAVKVLDWLIFSFIGLIFFLCPLYFTGLTAQGAGFDKVMLFYFLLILGVVAWITKGVIKGELEIKRTPLDWPILIFVGISALSTIFSIDKIDSLIGTEGNSARGLAATIGFALLYYLVVNNINAKRLKAIFWALVASSSLVVVYSLLQISGKYILPFSFTHRVDFNPIGLTSSLSMFLVVVMPLLVIAPIQLKKIHPKLKKIWFIIIKSLVILVSFAALAILAILNSFTFWWAAILGLVIILMFFMAKIMPINNKDLVVPLMFFLVFIVFLVLGNTKIMELNLPAEVSLSRKTSWDIAKNSLAHDPIIGTGPATFYYNFSRYKTADFDTSQLWNAQFNNASGFLFELLPTVGILGALSLVVVILISISMGFLSLLKPRDKEAHPIILALTASLAVICLYGLMFTVANSILLFIVLISILAAASAVFFYAEEERALKLSFWASPKYALALAAVFLSACAGIVILFTIGIKMYIADTFVQKAQANPSVNERIAELNRAIELFPHEDVYYLRLSGEYLNQANQIAGNGGSQVEIVNNLNQAINAGKVAVEISPNKAENIKSLAMIYENASLYILGALDWAQNYYNKLAELEPNNSMVSVRLAYINVARSNNEQDEEEKKNYLNEALNSYDEAIMKNPNSASAYYGKAMVFEKLSDNDQAIAQAKQAVAFAGDNLDYRFELGRLYFNKGVSSQPSLPPAETEELSEGEESELSVESSQPTGQRVKRNEYLNTSEQEFLNVLRINPNHANTLYGLGLLYQKIGEYDNARIAVERLLMIVDQETAQRVKEQFPGLY